MDAHAIEKYLTELGIELKNRGVKKPVRIMIIGGEKCRADRTLVKLAFLRIDSSWQKDPAR